MTVSTIDAKLIAFAILLISTVSSCSSRQKVTIDKQPAKVSYRVLADDLAASSKLIQEYGKTNWTFHCFTQFDYSIEQKTSDSAQAKVMLKITSIRMRLTLPIEVVVYKGAPHSVREHEQGHVNICLRIYEQADRAAREACATTEGKTYQGEANTVDDACSAALAKAADDICAVYKKNTAETTDRISARFDSLSAGKNSTESAFKRAFLED